MRIPASTRLTLAAAAAAIAITLAPVFGTGTEMPASSTTSPNWNEILASGSAEAASVDYFLKIDGIEGESADDKHKGEIEILSWSWGATNSGAHGSGGGGGAGKVSFQDLHFSASSSKASPKLFMAVATGEHIKKATLTARKSGQGGGDFLVITLEDVLVSSYQEGADSGRVDPTDDVALNFSKIEMQYRAQKPDGTLDSPVKACWDVAANKKC